MFKSQRKKDLFLHLCSPYSLRSGNKRRKRRRTEKHPLLKLPSKLTTLTQIIQLWTSINKLTILIPSTLPWMLKFTLYLALITLVVRGQEELYLKLIQIRPIKLLRKTRLRLLLPRTRPRLKKRGLKRPRSKKLLQRRRRTSLKFCLKLKRTCQRKTKKSATWSRSSKS